MSRLTKLARAWLGSTCVLWAASPVAPTDEVEAVLDAADQNIRWVREATFDCTVDVFAVGRSSEAIEFTNRYVFEYEGTPRLLQVRGQIDRIRRADRTVVPGKGFPLHWLLLGPRLFELYGSEGEYRLVPDVAEAEALEQLYDLGFGLQAEGFAAGNGALHLFQILRSNTMEATFLGDKVMLSGDTPFGHIEASFVGHPAVASGRLEGFQVAIIAL